MIWIGGDRGQHRPQLLRSARQIGAADLLSHTRTVPPLFIRLGLSTRLGFGFTCVDTPMLTTSSAFPPSARPVPTKTGDP
jgi:hypothetical protein